MPAMSGSRSLKKGAVSQKYAFCRGQRFIGWLKYGEVFDLGASARSLPPPPAMRVVGVGLVEKLGYLYKDVSHCPG